MKAIPFDHGDKAYSLRFDFNAMARYESQAGETMSQFLGDRDEINRRGAIDVRRTICILWASLNVRLPVDSVGGMVQEMGMLKASGLAAQAVGQALELLNSDPSLPKDGAESGNAKKD